MPDREEPVPAAMLAQIDQEEASIKEAVAIIIQHWEVCPARPRYACLGGIVVELHNAAHASPCKTSMMLQAALGALAKAEWERTHDTH